MDIFHITREDFEAQGFVIVATDELMCRLLAASNCGDEGQDVWVSKKTAVCQKIGTAKLPKRGEKQVNRIVLKSFK